MDNLGDLLKNKLGNSSLARSLDAAGVCEKAQNILGKRCRVISFVRGVLLLGVEDSYISSQIFFESEGLIEKINEKLGEERVKRLRFRTEEE